MIRNFLALFLSICVIQASGQDDLMDMFGDEPEAPEYAYAAFKTTRIVLGQSIENPKKGNLNMEIQHQFGKVSEGFKELYGLDQATMRFGFDYGLTDWFALGLGRSTYNKTFDGHIKSKLLRQSSGSKSMPLSISYFGAMFYNSEEWEDPNRDNKETSRLSYSHQLLIARKFSDAITFQLTPTLIHRNLVETIEDENDVYSLGAGGRVKMSKWMSLNLEYFYLLPGTTADNQEDAFSVGVDIETGGHVFQVYVTNATGMQENYFVAEAVNKWDKGELHLAFNLIRTFTIVKPKSIRKAKKAERAEKRAASAN